MFSIVCVGGPLVIISSYVTASEIWCVVCVDMKAAYANQLARKCEMIVNTAAQV